MPRTILLAFTLAFFAPWAIFAQDKTPAPAPVKYELSEVQKLRLENLQLKAKLAQQTYNEAQAGFNIALTALNTEAHKVMVDNKWPEDSQFDFDHLTFSAPPPKPEPPKPEKK